MTKRFITFIVLLLVIGLTGSSAQASDHWQTTLKNIQTKAPQSFSFEAGELVNQSSVSLSSGAAQFQLPIVIPGSPSGIQPSLALQYNSQLVNQTGIMGQGWNLSLGQIKRVNKNGLNKVYSGPIYAIELAGLSGEMVLVGSIAGVEEYALRRESQFAQIFYHTAENKWTVLTRQGTEYFLGSSLASQFANEDGSKVFSWQVDFVKNANGYVLNYNYQKDGNSLYPSSITYGAQENVIAPYEVRFTQGSRNDNRSSFSTGFKVEYRKVISAIEVLVNNQARFNYQFSYITDSLNSRSDLSSISVQGITNSGLSTQRNFTFAYYNSNEAVYHRKNLLKTITYPDGGQLSYDYQTSTGFKDQNGEMVNKKLPFNVTLVSSVTKNDGLGTSYTTNYQYEEGYFYYNSPAEREMAGFGRVIETDPLGQKTVYYFHQGGGFDGAALGENVEDHWALIGRLYRVEKRDASGIMVSRNINVWVNKKLGIDRYFPYISRSVSTIFDTTEISTAQGFVYDVDNGNLDQKTEYGKVVAQNNGQFTDVGNDLRQTIMTYAGPWMATQQLYNQQGQILVDLGYRYDNLPLRQVDKGNLTHEIQYDGAQVSLPAGRPVETLYQYDAFANLIKVTDPKGEETLIQYDAANLYPAKISNALRQDTLFEYDLMFGEVTKTIDANGLVTQTKLDGLGRSVETLMTDPGTNNQLVVMSTTNYQEGSAPKAIITDLYLDNQTTVRSIAYQDGLGRAIQSRHQAEGGKYTVTSVSYDALGRAVRQSLAKFEVGEAYVAPIQQSTDTITAYDALNRAISVTDANGATSKAYNGWETLVTDAKNKTTKYEKDAFGNLVKVTEANNAATEYSYDIRNLLIRLVDDAGNERNFVHDNFGRVISQEALHAAGAGSFGVWSYTYDDNGNLLSSLDPKGQTINYSYDALGRTLTEQLQNDPATLVSYQYDQNKVGYLDQVTQVGGDWQGQYDIRGRLISETQTIGAQSFAKQYQYTRFDQPSETVYPDNAVVGFAYDEIGQLDQINNGAQAIITGLDYSPHNQVKQIDYGNGIVSLFDYVPAQMYRLARKQSLPTPGVSGQLLQDITYGYDEVGNIISIVDNSQTAAAKSSNYAYDDLYRLTNVGGDYSRSYSYDSIGNILNKSDIGGYSYTAQQPQAVTNIDDGAGNTRNFVYDANGNVTRETLVTGETTVVKQFVWDHHDRLVQTDVDGVVVDYVYDQGGRRLKKGDNLYPFADYEVATTTTKVSVMAGNLHVATIEDASVVYYSHTDHLGGGSIISDQNADVVQALDYYPFGATRVNEQAATFDVREKFTGHELDEDTGIYYAQARYYDPEIGRWLSADPLGLLSPESFLGTPQELGLYTYVGNNPLKFIDPLGLETKIFVEKGKLSDGADAFLGHSFVVVTRGEESTAYSWQPEKNYGENLEISDSSIFLDKDGKNDDLFDVYVFDTTEKQEENIKDFYSGLYEKNNAEITWQRTKFDLINYNCLDVVVDAMKAGNVFSDSFGVSTLWGLKRNLNEKIKWQDRADTWRYKWFHSENDQIMNIKERKKIKTGE